MFLKFTSALGVNVEVCYCNKDRCVAAGDQLRWQPILLVSHKRDQKQFLLFCINGSVVNVVNILLSA